MQRVAFRYAFTALLLILLVPTPSFAFDLRQFGRDVDQFRLDVFGIVTDPLKVGEASSNALDAIRSLERIVSQIDELREKFDADVDGHLTNVQTILAQANADIENRIEQAATELRNLEQQLYRDALSLLREAECTLERMSNDAMLRSFASSINLIRRSNPTFLVDLGLLQPKGEIQLEQVAVIDPDKAYLAIRRERLAMLELVKEEDLAYSEVVSIYQNLGRLALATTCHYDRSGGSQIFLRDVNEFRVLSVPWLETVKVELR